MGQKYVYNPLTCEYDIIDEGAPGPVGPRGPVGAPGPAGADGTNGADGVGVVPGGSTGQVLAKASDDDYDTEWVNQSGGGGGGTTPGISEVLMAGNHDYNGTQLGLFSINTEQSSTIAPAQIQVVDQYKYQTLDLTPEHVFLSDGYGQQIGLNVGDVNQGRIPYVMFAHNGSELRLSRQYDDTSTGEVYLPPASFVSETLATQEWVTRSGATGSRPSSPSAGEMFLDTTVGKPIWYDGSQWIDANGTGV